MAKLTYEVYYMISSSLLQVYPFVLISDILPLKKPHYKYFMWIVILTVRTNEKGCCIWSCWAEGKEEDHRKDLRM